MYDFGVPPDSTFSTPEEAHVAINAFAQDHGYAVIRLRAYCDKKANYQRVFFAFDRQGVCLQSHNLEQNAVQEDLQKMQLSNAHQRCSWTDKWNVAY
ncbi:hypothetical protein LEN26_018635 [Aphanomyces euteiches]|nr:hypothetical protein LEN26_018635 [Aphanomyces euteiches]KAH9127121.1 hypothetical protein AeMF1_002531 [Aphanomyces euteiches]